MPQINVTNEEWQIAHQNLDQVPDGTKLPYSVCLNKNKQIVSRDRYKDEPKPYATSHSFIKINGKIFAIAQGKSADALMADGSMARVKYAKAEDGTVLLLKITTDASDEGVILNDVSQSFGEAKRQDKTKYYTTITYLGSNVQRYLMINKKSITEEQRLNMAIELCWKVHRLHEGHASKTGTPYAHLDLKPDNITIDHENNIHLIDYGLAQKFPNKKIPGVITGMYEYVAYQKYKDHPLTKVQYDIVALKRILYMPGAVYGKEGFMGTATDESILTKELLSKYNINEFINTSALNDKLKKLDAPDYSQDEMSAVTLSAILIAVKLKLDIDYHKIEKNKEIAIAITGLYFNNNAEAIKNTLHDENEIKLIAALNAINKMSQLNLYKDDPQLGVAIKNSKSYEAVTALIILKDNNLSSYYQEILANPDLAKTINTLSLAKIRPTAILEEKDRIDIRIKAINFLNTNQLPQYYDRVIKNDHFCGVIANIDVNSEAGKALISLLELNYFTDEELMAVVNNSSLAQAINILKPLELNERFFKNISTIYKNVISSPERVNAVIYCHKQNVDKYCMNRIVTSHNIICKAVDILSRTKNLIVSPDNLDEISRDEPFAKTIVLLAETKLDDIDKVYQFLMSDRSWMFTISEVSKILNNYPIDQITSNMIIDSELRREMLSVRDDQKKCALIFAEHGFNRFVNSLRYSLSMHLEDIIMLLNEKQLINENIVSKVFEKEKFHFELKSMIANQTDPERIIFAIENIHLLDKKPNDMRINTIDELLAYKAVIDQPPAKAFFDKPKNSNPKKEIKVQHDEPAQKVQSELNITTETKKRDF